ncbi:uncharacterized protein BDZ99DRAFT_456812 [Mytilinidion resinicola]|uniref:Xylanolytic transcriptional activator regulatory domain-containing protein n=1 Tax=Mytilinidion resinicola TaxID=574789 RepID=A0A6A6Z8G5_9PEZI|nr:uncharacterized protein BDZ99DRAFT_456812 [Mytilinidion resinicola]KAF2817009.1 hypothetical protein BDZ99DRAFT_456812 [Mytilinidion resinicola]
MAYALQLHRDLDYDPLGGENGERKKLSFIDREIRRRTMWACFLMDRFNSSGTERPLFVNEQFIQVQLPVREQLYIDEIPASTEALDGGVSTSNSEQLLDAKANMGVMAYLIRLVAIWGELIKYLNLGGIERETIPTWDPKSTFNCIKDRLRKFKETLPESLVHNEENLKSHAIEGSANQLLYMHILYYQSVLFLNRFARPSSSANGDNIRKLGRTSHLTESGAHTPNDIPQEFLAKAARNALEAAEQMSIVISASEDYNVVAPFVGYSAFFSSTIHIRGVFSKNPQLEAQSKKYLACNVKYLTKMKKYWGMFHYIAENLKDLYRQHADAVLRGSSAGNGKVPQEQIFQYGDWFDRYPHGVSNTDYEDPATKAKREPGTDAVLGQKSDLQSVEEFFASLSPPSRAEHQRKMAKKKKQNISTKDDAPPSIDATARLQPQPSPSQQTALQHPPQDLHQMHLQPDVVENFDPAYYASNPANASFPAPFSQIPGQPQPQSHAENIGLMSHAATANPLLPLDLSTFAGSSAPDLWNLDLGGMPNTGGMGSGFFPDQSMAWFMPFNMEPPTLGDDGVFVGDGWGFGGPQIGTGDVLDEGGGMGS